MAGVGYGVTPMSRLSHHSSRRRSHTGKPLDLSSPNSLSKKKAPKRKTLSSRYSAVLPSKRRRLGLNTIGDSVISLGESHQAPEARHAAVSTKSCNASEVLSKERESRHSGTRGTAHKAKPKAKARAREANARVKASRGFKAETSKPLDSEEISNEEAHSSTGLFHLNATAEVGSLPDGNHDGSSIPDNVNLKVGSHGLETREAGAFLTARKSDFDSTHAEPRQSTEKHLLVASREPGRKSSKWFSTLEQSDSGLRALKDHTGNENNIPTLTGHRVQEFPVQDIEEGTSLLKQDSSTLEGSFLRPRRKAKNRSKLEEHRLPPLDYVGKRVVVYWPHAKAWYAGKVIMYDDTSKKHKIKYDDSDEECISFRRHKVILEKSLPIQLADGQNKASFSAHRVQFPGEKVVAPKPVQGDQVDGKCVVGDNVLLSAFASRHRGREGSNETLCNGSVIPTGAVKGLDATASNNAAMHKSSKKSSSLATQDNTGRPAADKTTSGGKEAFVYVRRTKVRRKVEVLSTDTAIDERIYESNAAAAALEQEPSRKRKSRQVIWQHTAQTEFSDCTFYDDESSFSDAPAICGTRGNGSTASERASRKRNKRSLKKLVSQASIAVATEIAHEQEPQRDQLRKQKAKRSRRKLVRKHKLNNARFSARNRRLPTKRVLCLADDMEGQAFEGSSSTLCHNAAKLYNFDVPARDMRMPESVSLFVDTIHLVIPAVIPGLFTWKLFSILTCMHFCDGGSFDEVFSLNASLRDWTGIFRVFVLIIKAVPLSAYMNGRQWQCMILHELWNSMQQGELVQVDALPSLSPEVETLISENLLNASVNCRMTNREILNLFVFYIIKPYIFATISEKGISIQVAIQQFLLLIRSKVRGTSCLRQSVRQFLLQPNCGSADKAFSSYLMHFPRSTDWCSERGLFLRQMEEWITTTRQINCADSWNPISAIKKLDHQVWQVISTHILSGRHAMDELKERASRKIKLFKLEHLNTESDFLNDFLHCSRHGEVRNSLFGQEHSSLRASHNGCCLNAALLFTARLQRRLFMTVGMDLDSTEANCHPTTVFLHSSKASLVEQQTKLIGQSASAAADASEFKFSACLSNLATINGHTVFPRLKPSLVVNVPSKHVKVEPDINLSRRNSSITTESNSAGIKEESSIETYVRQEPLNSLLLKSDFVGQSHVGFRVKTDEQHFSGQMDLDYYDSEFSKNVKIGPKGRPRYRSERQQPLSKKRPTYFCIADLLFINNGCLEREIGARVELQLNADCSFLIAAHVNGKSFEQKVLGGGMLAKNPPEFSWKSVNGWGLEFPDREQWELFRCMHNELCSQAMRTTCSKEIPIPVVKEMGTCYGEAQARSSLRPFFAIKSPGDEIERAFRTGRVLYDLDSEDESWMAETNSISRDFGGELISDDSFEQIIDRLEKEAYKRGEETVSVHDAIELCQGLAVADSVRAVHTYWFNKRLAKGMSLLRYFQPPLWEQYQDQLRAWDNRMQQFSPDSQNTRPIMSAFCLQSRSFDTLDNCKRILRQRSQRKIRPTSRSSSEDSPRLPVYRHSDSSWHLTHDSERAHSSTRMYQHLDHGQEDERLPDSSKGARAKAVEARKVAERRSLKLQRRFLEFDLSLQRAWALLIEYTVSGGDESAQSKALEGRMKRLFTRCSSLFSRGDDSSEDEPPSHSGQVCRDVGEEFLEAFSKKCSLNGKVCQGQDKAEDNSEETSPLLPIFVKGSSYAWNGSSLL